MPQQIQHRPAFTLIELVTSLSIMSVLLLGLSGAVMISAQAIPSATETGIADQRVIDVLNQMRADLGSATDVKYRTNVVGWELTATIKSSTSPGKPSKVLYTYITSAKTLDRKLDARVGTVVLTDITLFALSINQSGSDATSVFGLLNVDKTIQRTYEMHALLPDKPVVK